MRRGVAWDDIFAGYCDGAEEARELHGVEVRLTPDIVRGFPLDEAEPVVRYSVKYADRGVVGVGLGGLEAQYPPEPYAPVFELAKEEGLGSVPHAGEVAGPASVRGALEALGADRIRHGFRAVEDAELVAELAERGTVLDVSPDLERPHRRGRRPWPSIRCRRSSPPACAARSRPTTPPCSTPI